MFGDLMKFGGTTGNLDFYKEVPTFRFDTPEGKGTYKIISVFKTNTLSAHGEFFNYMISDFENDKDFMNYVYNVRVRSLFNCPVDVNEVASTLSILRQLPRGEKICFGSEHLKRFISRRAVCL